MTRRHFLLLPVALAAPKTPDVLLVGDSLAFQLAPRLAKEARARGLLLAADGRGGSSLKQWLDKRWFRAALRRVRAPLVLVSLGVNCTPAERGRFTADADKLATLAKGRRVVWLMPPPLRYPTQYIDDAVAELDLEHFAPGPLPMEWDSEHNRKDVHPTSKGHELWARKLAEWLWS